MRTESRGSGMESTLSLGGAPAFKTRIRPSDRKPASLFNPVPHSISISWTILQASMSDIPRPAILNNARIVVRAREALVPKPMPIGTPTLCLRAILPRRPRSFLEISAALHDVG